MNDTTREPQFHLAIGQLLEARFQMALAGDQADIEQLYADVQLLNDHNPKSVAAAEGVYYIAKFAHTKAGLLGRTQPQWFETLSRWAREFADRFPEQNNRAVTLLFGAARSCELHSGAASDARRGGTTPRTRGTPDEGRRMASPEASRRGRSTRWNRGR